MTANITPLHDRVLVRRLEEKETARGGIIIPDTAKGNDINIDDQEYLILREEEILVKLSGIAKPASGKK
jgi:co-chaperonin GroES (HSP10)